VPRLSNISSTHWRLFFVFLAFVIIAASVASRLFYLQVLRYKDLVTVAAKQSGRAIDPPRRGTIYFQDKNEVLVAAAINREYSTLIASPRLIADPANTASQISSLIEVPQEEIERKLSQENDPYEVLERKIDDAVAAKIAGLGLKGLVVEKQSRRMYPGNELGAHVLGFVKFDADEESGEYGIERAFNKSLAGETGILEGITDPAEYIVTLGKRIVHPETNGKNIVLTIDPNIQKRAEEKLKAVMEKYTAEGGTVTVVEPSTGRILALAGAPSFDPNNYGSAKDLGVFMNRVVESNYELGSVMKPITMASAINEGVVRPGTTYDDTGEVKIGGYRIQNFDGKPHGVQTMTNVLEKSLNTGAVFVERKIGNPRFLEYLKLFGFGEKAGIDMPGEVAGNISNLAAGREIDFATASFGQGIAVTPLQMAMALSAIANGGNLMKPYVVEKIMDDSGGVVEFKPEVRRRVISTETAETVTQMLVSVVENGFEHRADVPGYFIAAKTGTAQIPDPNGGGYSKDDFIHSFMGYAPAFEPRFLIFIQLVKPRGVNFASNSLTSTFRELANYIINYYGILPDRPVLGEGR